MRSSAEPRELVRIPLKRGIRPKPTENFPAGWPELAGLQAAEADKLAAQQAAASGKTVRSQEQRARMADAQRRRWERYRRQKAAQE